jgi:hypothetical protein
MFPQPNACHRGSSKRQRLSRRPACHGGGMGGTGRGSRTLSGRELRLSCSSWHDPIRSDPIRSDPTQDQQNQPAGRYPNATVSSSTKCAIVVDASACPSRSVWLAHARFYTATISRSKAVVGIANQGPAPHGDPKREAALVVRDAHTLQPLLPWSRRHWMNLV